MAGSSCQSPRGVGVGADRLSAALAKDSDAPPLHLDEKACRFLHNQDPIAVDRLSDGIRRFYADARKLEQLASEILAKGGWMTRWARLPLLLGILLAASAVSRQPGVPRLSAITEGGKGPPTIVLLHGYCSSEKDWAPFARSIRLPPGTRFLFPRGPETAKRTDGGPAGRAWWHLALAADVRDQGLGADLSAEKPRGIEPAARAVRALLARRGNRAAQPFILGGFSQGAMVAAQVAFLSDEPLRALVLLSGTLVDETSWKANFARRKGLHVFIAHGRADPTLSFEAAKRMQSEMTGAGIEVTWFPFDGGHETPAEVVVALNDFLARL